MNQELAKKRDRHEAVRIAREEFIRITNQNRVRHALKAKVPQAADVVIKEGVVNGYSEPKKVVQVDPGGRMVAVQEKPDVQKLYSLTYKLSEMK